MSTMREDRENIDAAEPTSAAIKSAKHSHLLHMIFVDLSEGDRIRDHGMHLGS
ncbi:hypothetical protein ACTXOR_10725 [Arthrobacter rhombi]|uniref:hypothetical protein n=1 Tax=Arthrobacter rhombi TaxID=71253 RepID=UPI003FCF7674